MAENQDVTEEKPLNKHFIKYKDRKFSEKLCYLKENITVEPLFAGLIIPSVISRFAMGNFNLDKACRVNFAFGDEVCNALVKKNSNNFTEYERQVQTLISSIDIWRSVINTALPCIIIMFLGAWSDRTGKRKICILLPIFGELMTSINNIVNVFFFYEIPVEITVFLETFFTAATGGWVTMFLGVFSYISDITSEKSRTFRVGLVSFCMTVGVPIGIALGGILVQRMGYYGLFSSTSILFTFVLLYGCFCLKEPDDFLQAKGFPKEVWLNVVARNDFVLGKFGSVAEAISLCDTSGPRELRITNKRMGIVSYPLKVERTDNKDVAFFDVSHVVDTVNVAFRRRASNARVKVILTLVAVFVIYGPAMSEHGVFYLFVRNQLNWDMVKYSFFASYSIILHSIGVMFSITILSKKLQFDDSLLCVIAMVSKFTGAVWTAFVKTDVEMILIPIIEFFSSAIMTSLRSMITKLVEKDETAKVNSLFALTETLASLVFHPLYSWLYMKTLKILPGAVFLTSAALIIPASVILVYFFIQHRKAVSTSRKLALETQEKKDTEADSAPDKLYLPENIKHSNFTEKPKL